MIYLATPSGPRVREAMAAGLLGQIVTPPQGSPPLGGGIPWAMDNGCFSEKWDPTVWTAALRRHQHTPGCLFATIPDVVADARATNEWWARWHGTARNLGYRCAYVLQDGCESVPASASAVFVGGSTEWKLGPQARVLVAKAKAEERWVHMGRVNSLRRIRYAADIGCDSADGTYLAFGPDVNLPRLLSWMHPAAPSLFGGVA